MEWQDCYGKLQGDLLILGNARIERKIRVTPAFIMPLSLLDKRTGKTWDQPEEGCRLIPVPFSETTMRMEAFSYDRQGLSERHLMIRLIWENPRGEKWIREFSIYPQMPFISQRLYVVFRGEWQDAQNEKMIFGGAENRYGEEKAFAAADTVDILNLPRRHLNLTEVKLLDQSDRRDTLVMESSRPLYNMGWGQEEGEGNLFFLEDALDGSAIMIVKEAPCFPSMLGRGEKELLLTRNRSLQIRGSGLIGQTLNGEETPVYGVTMGVGRKEEIVREFRRLYRADWLAGDQVRIYSNTWGDRSRDRAVCHDFVMGEIDRAAELGVQVVQIDDGWQKGHTANSALKKKGAWGGFYDQDPDFWQVNREKFPGGLAPICRYAREKGVEMALWFGPDSAHDFVNWQRDAETLLNLYHSLGIRRFKLDSVTLQNKICEKNFLSLLARLQKESGGRILVNQDITASIRLGHIYFREYGNIFVENRYTDAGSYYPHHTLKNLWQLSHYIPAARLQMESLNPRRNRDKYPFGDPFAPEHYSMDYLFAITLPASPLIWMEMTHLPEKDAKALQKIIRAYLPHQSQIARADCRPIGEKPDGQSFTGFQLDSGEEGGYLLLFREYTEESEGVFHIPDWQEKNISMEMLCSNQEKTAVLGISGENVRLHFPEKRCYAFVRYRYA